MTDGDPRLTGDFVRRLPASGSADVVLVGVVHDHPASTYRVSSVVEDAEPDVLALELPPVAVPLFERYAEDGRTPPALGGEMSTAIQAAGDAEVVGIDGPSLAFAKRLLRHCYRDGASVSDVRSAMEGLWSATKHAVACRLAAATATWTGLHVEVAAPVDHGCRWHDDPGTQAADERRQVRRARAVASAFGLADAVRYRKDAREGHMADRLSEVRGDGTTVAVVGIDHLDPLAAQLEEGTRAD